jgi:hypothetical protein
VQRQWFDEPESSSTSRKPGVGLFAGAFHLSSNEFFVAPDADGTPDPSHAVTTIVDDPNVG